MQKGDRRAFGGYFLFEKRAIWYYSYGLKEGELRGKKITVFLDERLKVEEGYLSRTERDDAGTLETFFEVQHRRGTISVITDLDESGERIYNLLKSRAEIETMSDAFKNVLNADRAYMRDDYQMECWMFINFVALVFYYRIHRLLADNSLLKKLESRFLRLSPLVSDSKALIVFLSRVILSIIRYYTHPCEL